MSKQKIRENKSCLNCGRFVAEKYCPNCGQKNVELRDSIRGMFKNFATDLIHYESSIWTTIKLLLLSPATLSQEYIRGRRRSYIDPIKLYIFISFEALFIPGILPQKTEKVSDPVVEIHSSTTDSTQITNPSIVTIAGVQPLLSEGKQNRSKESIFKTLLLTVASKIKEDKTPEQEKQLKKFMLYNLPKVLFLYMPFFAFWLWLLNNKKKFLYFDSGVFTLHFFSFLLLIISMLMVVDCAFDWLGLPDYAATLAGLMVFGYIVYSFFKANHLFYGGDWVISCLKTGFVFTVGIILICIFMFLYLLLALYMI